MFDVDVFTLWTLIHVSNMHLQLALKLTGEMLRSGFNVLAMLRHLEQDDYQLLDPIICVSVKLCGRVLQLNLYPEPLGLLVQRGQSLCHHIG